MAICKEYQCPNCKVVSTAGQWNAATLKYATDNHKKFTTKIQNCGKAPNMIYICPGCGNPQRKNTIRPMLAEMPRPKGYQLVGFDEMTEFLKDIQ